MLYDMKIIKYEYDVELNIVNIYCIPELKYIQYWNERRKVIPLELKKILNPYAWNTQYELENGEHHYLNGDAIYIEKKEYDDREYVIFGKLYSCILYYDNKTKKNGYVCDITDERSQFEHKCKKI